MRNFLQIPLVRALRPNQWIKNLILYTAIIFTGELFDSHYFWLTTLGFLVFSTLSSSSYLFNDIIDLKFDKLHPVKKNRPLASGKLPLNKAVEAAFLLGLFGLIAALLISVSFFLVALFVAATKRHAELLKRGTESRPALFQYRDRLLDSYTSMFGSASIIAYSLFTFLEEPPKFSSPTRQFLVTV